MTEHQGNADNSNRPNSRLTQDLFTSFFEGVVLSDADKLTSVTMHPYNGSGYLIETMLHETENLVYDIHSGSQYFNPTVLRSALEVGIQSYEYSDVPFEADLVEMAVGVTDLDRKWLKQTVKPTSYILNNIVEVNSKAEFEAKRRRGYQAMGALGLTSRLRKRFKL